MTESKGDDGIRILIVEDDRLIAEYLQHQLESFGYSVVGWTDNGAEALDLARLEKPDLVIMDVVLKGDLDGIQTAEKISPLDIPVIFATGYADERILGRAKKVLPAGYLLKPYRGPEIRAVVEMGLYAADLSAQKKEADRALRKSEEFTAKVLDLSHNGLFILDLEKTEPVFINRQYTQVLGFTLEDLKGIDFRSLLHPEDTEKANECLTRIREIDDGQFREIEVRFRRKDGAWRWCLVRTLVFDRNDRGEVTRIIGTFFDITERKETEEALRRSEDRHRSLVEQLPAIFYTASLNQPPSALYLSPQIEEITGYGVREFLDDPKMFDRVVHPHDRSRVLEEISRPRKAGDSFTSEYRFRTKRGGYIWIRNQAVVVDRGDEEGLILQGLMFDITELKEARQALRKSERFASKIVDSSHSGIYIFDISRSRVVFINPQVVRLTGYTLDDLNAMSAEQLDSLQHPEDRPAFFRQRELVASAGDEDRINYEYRLRKRDGDYMWCLARESVFSRGPDGSVEQVLGTFLDISERKKAEEQLNWDLEVRAALTNLAREIMTSASLDEISKKVLESARSLTGSRHGFCGYIDPDKDRLIVGHIAGDAWDRCLIEDKRVVFERFHGLWGRVLKEGRPILTNEPGADPHSGGLPEGHLAIDRFLSAPSIAGGLVVGQVALANSDRDYLPKDLDALTRLADLYALAIQRERTARELESYREHLQDLVDQKTLDLRASREQLVVAQRIARIGSYDIDPRTGEVVWSDEHYRLLGYEPGEVRPGFDVVRRHVHPEDREKHARLWELALEDRQAYDNTYRIVTREGLTRTVHSVAKAERDREGEIIRLRGIFQDVTEQVAAEERIRESEERFSRFMAFLPGMAFIKDSEGRYVYVNRATGIETDPTPEDRIGKTDHELFDPETAEVFSENDQRVRETGRSVEVEENVPGPDGYRLCVVQKFPITIRGESGYIGGITMDITDLRETQEALRESEERYRTVADFTYDWEVWMDPQGKLIYISPSCERITGYTAEEFKNRDRLMEEIVHPEDLEEFRRHSVISDRDLENPLHLSFRIITRSGEERWISHWCVPVFNAKGEYLGRRASNRDITERHRVEEELKIYHERLRSMAAQLTLTEERERRRIATDLHDGLGQSLALSQIKAEQVRAAIKEPEQAREMDTVISLIEKVIHDVRTLTFEISPQTLYEIGLLPALEELAEQYQEEYGIRIGFWTDKPTRRLGADARAAVYRAVREIMINSIKHAGADSMELVLKEVGDELQIQVVDNGRGFDPVEADKAAQKNKSFGLFSMRERLGFLGGRIKVDSRPGRGTKATITLPLPDDWL